MDELELVSGLRARREEAVSAFLERYRSLLLHCIGHFEQESSARDDLFQELVLYVLERLDADRFDPEKGSLGTWLYRVAWCRCVDLRRRHLGRRAAVLGRSGEQLPEGVDEGPGPGEVAGDSEVGEFVRRAMTCLDLEERRLLELRFVEERPLADVAQLLRLSVEQTKYRLKRASAALRKVLLNDFALVRHVDNAGLLTETPQKVTR
jgi:RNA polymerase sigma-70 factor, ECF subfamily